MPTIIIIALMTDRTDTLLSTCTCVAYGFQKCHYKHIVFMICTVHG